MPYSANVGLRVIHTDLQVTQLLAGLPGQYGTEPAAAGNQVTSRSYTDVLPAANFALNMTDQLTMRLSYSKNMMPLDLSKWGGGLQLGYSLLKLGRSEIHSCAGDLDGESEPQPVALLELRRLGRVLHEPDKHARPRVVLHRRAELHHQRHQDQLHSAGRGRCGPWSLVVITEPIQGSGNSIHGAEFDYRQGFTFLPGLLANTGMEFNFTYAPSNTGETDLAGNKIPFQDNSTESGNFILWYQDKRFQARLAYNYRSKRASMEDVGGISGLEMYEAPQKYLDAAIAYKVSKYAEVFVNGTNLTNEYQRYYLVWPDQPAHSNFSERTYTVGVRGQW